MSADQGKDGRDMLALQARVSEALAQLARADAEAVKVAGMVKALGSRVFALETRTETIHQRWVMGLDTLKALGSRVAALESTQPSPETPQVDPALALAELADRIDGNTPGRVAGNEVDKLESRERLTAVE